jgi:hypothetical protein
MRLAALVLLGALALNTSVMAQERPAQQHRGLWGGFGLGGGIDGDEGNTWGVSGYGRIGGTLSQKVLLAGESSGWIGSHQGVDLYRSNLSAVILFYPSVRGGLFFKGGMGFSYITTSISEFTNVGGIFYSSSVSHSQGGFGATAGAGYDVRLGRNIYLVPEVDWYLQAVGTDDSFFGVPSTVNIFAFSLGLVWH